MASQRLSGMHFIERYIFDLVKAKYGWSPSKLHGSEVGPITFFNYYFCDTLTYMYYVYLLRSTKYPEKTYIGFTYDIPQRLERHNAGYVSATTNFKPWKIVAYIAFDSKEKAMNFEKYLKVGSGHAFAQRRLW